MGERIAKGRKRGGRVGEAEGTISKKRTTNQIRVREPRI